MNEERRRFVGTVTATPEAITLYLRENWLRPDGRALSWRLLARLLAEHEAIVRRGVGLRSPAGIVGDDIAERAGLNPRP